MNQKIVLILFALVLCTGCGGGKGISGSSLASSDLAIKTIIASHDNATPEFNTMAARVQVVYEDDEKLQSITVSLRMEKDKTIWIKASLLGITLAKVLVTPTKVSYYETITNTYFDGDFSLLSEWLGTEIDFEKAQAILLGQSIFTLSSAEYRSSVEMNKYKLQPKIQPQNFIHSLFLFPDNFKVASETVSQPSDGRILTVRYGDYQNIEGRFFPSEIQIDASENESKTRIEVNYKKIDLNVSISFPFTIPDGYEEIQL
jgi:outer membrane biogenesis lipoprotein LolB